MYFINIVMNISINPPVYFGAKFVNNTTVGKKDTNTDTYHNEYVSFVEIEPDNQKDLDALENCAKYWRNDDFAMNISHAANAIHNKSKYYKSNRVFALTSQKSDYDNLDDNKILGLVHISEFCKESAFIEHLQVNPDMIFDKNSTFDFTKEREYKGGGTGILNSLKQLYWKITLFPSSSDSVKNFYKKNGFVEYPPHTNNYVWYKEI